MDIKRELVLQLHLMGKKNFEILEQLKIKILTEDLLKERCPGITKPVHVK